eukprot:344714-Chlamydomonas_euryale.AAC.4
MVSAPTACDPDGALLCLSPKPAFKGRKEERKAFPLLCSSLQSFKRACSARRNQRNYHVPMFWEGIASCGEGSRAHQLGRHGKSGVAFRERVTPEVPPRYRSAFLL